MYREFHRLQYNYFFHHSDILHELLHYHDLKSEKYHLLVGLSKILTDIDKAISIIRHTEKEEMVIPNLMKEFSIEGASFDKGDASVNLFLYFS